MDKTKTKVLLQRYAKLRGQRGKKGHQDWWAIFHQVIGDFSKKLELVFTKSTKAKNTFEAIVADFYLRPAYWVELFGATLDAMELESLGTVSSHSVNPIVASQFADFEEWEILARYTGGRLSPIYQRKISVFDNLQGNAGYAAAKKFFREYFLRDASDYTVLIFWNFILNSIVRDLFNHTTGTEIQRAIAEKDMYIRKNVPTLTRSIQNTTKPLITLQGQTFLVAQGIRPEIVANKILGDITSNWVFVIPIQIGEERSLRYVVGPKYLPRVIQTKNRKLLTLTQKHKSESMVLARQWVKNFIEQKEIPTFMSLGKYGRSNYVPITILLDEKPTRDYEIKTISKDVAQQYIQKGHRYVPIANPRGAAYAVGAYSDEELIGVMMLNTLSASATGFPGQYHAIEISRVAVSERWKREGIGVMLTQWAIDNAKLFNRSEYEEANVVTFSLLEEPGTTYSRVQTLYPTDLVKPDARPTTDEKVRRKAQVTDAWKIRWESNPADPSFIKPWLKKFHPIFMRLYKGLQSYSGERINDRKISSTNLRGINSLGAYKSLFKMLYISRPEWRAKDSKLPWNSWASINILLKKAQQNAKEQVEAKYVKDLNKLLRRKKITITIASYQQAIKQGYPSPEEKLLAAKNNAADQIKKIIIPQLRKETIAFINGFWIPFMLPLIEKRNEIERLTIKDLQPFKTKRDLAQALSALRISKKTKEEEAPNNPSNPISPWIDWKNEKDIQTLRKQIVYYYNRKRLP